MGWLRLARQLDQARQDRRDLDPGEASLVGLGIAQRDGDRQGQGRDVRERVARVDGERREHRVDLGEEPLAQRRVVLRAPSRSRRSRCPRGRARLPDLAVDRRVLVDEVDDPPPRLGAAAPSADGPSPIVATRASRAARRRPEIRTWKNSSRLEAKIARNFTRSRSGLRASRGLVQDARVELDPGQLAAEVGDAPRAMRAWACRAGGSRRRRWSHGTDSRSTGIGQSTNRVLRGDRGRPRARSAASTRAAARRRRCAGAPRRARRAPSRRRRRARPRARTGAPRRGRDRPPARASRLSSTIVAPRAQEPRVSRRWRSCAMTCERLRRGCLEQRRARRRWRPAAGIERARRRPLELHARRDAARLERRIASRSAWSRPRSRRSARADALEEQPAGDRVRVEVAIGELDDVLRAGRGETRRGAPDQRSTSSRRTVRGLATASLTSISFGSPAGGALPSTVTTAAT